MATASLSHSPIAALLLPYSRRVCMHEAARTISELIQQALLREVELTPKPGLVDRANSGAHQDMDLSTFHASTAAITPWFAVFHRMGATTRTFDPEQLLAHLRPAGRAAERAMLRVTHGVNTHKGAIFSLGLLAAAAGRISRHSLLPDRNQLCAQVAELCAHLVAAELHAGAQARTAGEKLFHIYGLTGARGEAASGFATVRSHALPAYERTLAAGGTEEHALQEALLHLLANNPDTNLVHRGGLDGLAYVQQRAQSLLAAGGVETDDFLAQMQAFDADLIARNLSPGGSADLLAVTWFLAQLPASRPAKPIRCD